MHPSKKPVVAQVATRSTTLHIAVPALQDAGPGTPICVFLSPGVDVAGSVEALGRKLGFTQENGKYFSVSLGQGQVRPGGGGAPQHLLRL